MRFSLQSSAHSAVNMAVNYLPQVGIADREITVLAGGALAHYSAVDYEAHEHYRNLNV